jgi:hypothetical protein
VQELGFLKSLQAARIPLNEYEFPANKIANIQPQVAHRAAPPRRARADVPLSAVGEAGGEELLLA